MSPSCDTATGSMRCGAEGVAAATLSTLRQHLMRGVSRCATEPEVWNSVAETLAVFVAGEFCLFLGAGFPLSEPRRRNRVAGTAGAAHGSNDVDTSISIRALYASESFAALTTTPPQQWPTSLCESLRQAAGEILAGGSSLSRSAASANGFALLAAPVAFRDSTPACLLAIARRDSCDLPELAASLEFAAASITLGATLLDARQAELDQRRALGLAAMLGRFCEPNDERTALFRIVNDLQPWLGCRQVAFGWAPREGNVARLAVLSGQSHFDPSTPLARAFGSSLTETLRADAPIDWSRDSASNDDSAPAEPSNGATRPLTFPALAELTGSSRLTSLVLRTAQGDAVGAILFADVPRHAEGTARMKLLRESSGGLAAAGERLRTSRPGYVASRWVQSAVAPRHRQRRFLWMAGIAIAIGALMVPVPYRPRCDCRIEPVTRRFVAAPFDGALAEAMVKPGDVVKAGQTLAKLDERTIGWEMSGLDAEASQARKRYDAALADRNASAAQLAQLEIRRIEARRRLLENRSSEMSLTSPIDGVVVRGDWERSEGAPLTIGQTLFEIAPLDKMIAEVAIPDDQLPYIHEGTHIRIRLDAFPHRVWSAEVSRIHPRSELRDDENVFVAEVPFANDDELLRPGMAGNARASSGWRIAAWIALRRPIAALAQRWGW